MSINLQVIPGYNWLLVPNDRMTYAKLALAAVPQVQIADGALTTGLFDEDDLAEFIAAQISAAGRKNILINGALDFWQRGTSFAGNVAGNASYYTADRWWTSITNANRTITRNAFALVDAPAGSPRYYLRWAQTVATSPVQHYLSQFIEGVRTLAGQKATVSFWCQADEPATIGVRLDQHFGTGGTPSSATTTPRQDIIISGAAVWQRFQTTFDVPTVTNKTVGTDDNDVLLLRFFMPTGAPFVIRFANIQLEAGEQMTPFEIPAPGVERRAVERYYEVIKTVLANGITTNIPVMFYKVTKRAVVQPVTLSILGDSVTPYAQYYTALDAGSAYQSLTHALAITTQAIDAEFYS